MKTRPLLRNDIHNRDLAWQRYVLTFILVWTILSCKSSFEPKHPYGDTVAAGDYEYLRDYMNWYIRQKLDSSGTVGLSVAIADKQQIIWEKGFGYSDLKTERKTDAKTVFELGSVSKLFTSIAVMQDVEKGKYSLDSELKKTLKGFSIRPLEKDLYPDARYPDAPIRIRNILTHHSGLPGDNYSGMFAKVPRDQKEYLDLVSQDYKAFPVNYIHAYSNLGFGLLGVLLEQKDSRSFSRLMQDRILDPIGMENSSFSLDARVQENLSKGYIGKEEKETLNVGLQAAGALRSSAHDMALFIRTILNDGATGEGSVISPQVLRKMWKKQNTNVPLDMDLEMGLGWFLKHDHSLGKRMVYHGGATLYFHSSLMILPDEDIGVVVLGNSAQSTLVIENIAEELLRVALSLKYGHLPEKKGIRYQPNQTVPKNANSICSNAEGYYQTQMGFYHLKNEGGYLEGSSFPLSIRLIPNGKESFRLSLRIFSWFSILEEQLGDIEITIRPIGERTILGLGSWNEFQPFGEKLKPVKIPSEWKDYSGEYKIQNPDSSFDILHSLRLYESNGFLLAETKSPMVGLPSIIYALHPVSRDQAVIRGVGRGLGDSVVIRRKEGKTEIHTKGLLLERSD